MTQYSTGTISVTNGSATVNGTDTLWVSSGMDALPPLLWLYADSRTAKVDSITGEGTAILQSPWQGQTLSDIVYRFHTDFGASGLPILDSGDIGTLPVISDGFLRIETILDTIFDFGPGDTFTYTGGGAGAIDLDQYDIIARLVAGTGSGAAVGQADLTEEPSPSAGDYLLGWIAEGPLRKFDVGDLATGGLTGTEFVSSDAGNLVTQNPKHWVGTQANYDAIATPDPNTIYDITA